MDRRRGYLYGLLSAALFGVSPPLCKLLLGQVAPVMMAGCLYLAGGLALTLFLLGRRLLGKTESEARLQRSDAPILLGIVLLGGIAGPVLMLLGLQRLSGFTGSLLLNLEAPLTMALAVLIFREHLSKKELVAAAIITAGAVLMRMEPGATRADLAGVLCIAGACLSWALDNNLSQRLTLRDPARVARFKTLTAGAANLTIALSMGQAPPQLESMMALFAIGALGYGASLVLDNHALRALGAAREAAIFSSAPFLGALAALVLLKDRPTAWQIAGAALMFVGVVTLLRARHGHRHRHDSMSHEHAHSHDAHHQHPHRSGDPSGEPHSHPHTHEPIEHEHPHASDLHHRHRH
jgi:drug/metabolite transporter (DMT)-like permease